MATRLKPRDYVIEEYTTTVCPHCFAERTRRTDESGTFVDGMLVAHHGSIWMRRFCPRHGESESLYEEDAEIWRARAGWNTPTLQVIPDRAGNVGGFPDAYRLFLITGFLGGLTTFSSFSLEMVALLNSGRVLLAVVAGFAHLAGSLALTLLGAWTARSVFA